MTHDLYFTILVEVFMNRILAENMYLTNHIECTEHKIMVLKPANKYQIIWYCHNFENILIDDFGHDSIPLLRKRFSNIIFANCKDQTINNSNIYLLLDLLGRQKSIS